MLTVKSVCTNAPTLVRISQAVAVHWVSRAQGSLTPCGCKASAVHSCLTSSSLVLLLRSGSECWLCCSRAPLQPAAAGSLLPSPCCVLWDRWQPACTKCAVGTLLCYKLPASFAQWESKEVLICLQLVILNTKWETGFKKLQSWEQFPASHLRKPDLSCWGCPVPPGSAQCSMGCAHPWLPAAGLAVAEPPRPF